MDEPTVGAAVDGTQAASLPSVGLLLGDRYRLSGKIGRGSSADVFGARDELLGRPVAVKMFRFDTGMGEHRRRIDAEMRLLASLHHPGLVAIYDAGVLAGGGTEGTPYLVMELVNGPSLSEKLDDGPLGEADTARLGAELATTLAYIHATDIVHRDIKPANILLGPPIGTGHRHSAKLADFGIARMVDTTRLTFDGQTVGTPNYLSPEQAEGGDVGPPTDVYALGLVLVQCLTGAPAFPGTGIEAALARLHSEPAIPHEFGPGWVGVLTAMTARDPNERPTAAEVTGQLLALAQDGPLAADSPTRSLDLHRPPRRRAPLALDRRRAGGVLAAVAGLAVLLVLLVLGISMAARGHDQHPAAPNAPSPYPSVSGQLGRDLQQLQRTVQ